MSLFPSANTGRPVISSAMMQPILLNRTGISALCSDLGLVVSKFGMSVEPLYADFRSRIPRNEPCGLGFRV